MRPKKLSLLLAGGYFPEPRPRNLWMTSLEYVEREDNAGREIQSDFPIFGLPMPDTFTQISAIPAAFWQSFSSEYQYYEWLMEDACSVIVLALSRAPEHRERLNLISFLCDNADPMPIPLSIHLF